MARKKKEIAKSESITLIKPETVQIVIAIVLVVIAVFSILAAFNKAGFLGVYTFSLVKNLLGVGYFLLPVLLLMLAYSFAKSIAHKFETLKVIGSILFFLSALGIVDLLVRNEGGYVGHLISSPLLKLFDSWVTFLVLFAVLIISIIITFESYIKFESLMFWKSRGIEDKMVINQSYEGDEDDDDDDDSDEDDEAKDKEEVREASPIKKPASLPEKAPALADKDIELMPRTVLSNKKYVPPPLKLLEHDRGKPEVGDIKANANIIKRTLQNFHIDVEMDEISIGPSVTRYALKPAEGVKLSKILALNNDLALALAAHPIRIEAPIPGKSLVGIEIPNQTKTTVGLATLLASPDFEHSDKPLMVAMGKGISGKAHFSNLAKAPHMLIAGATGSGKSVTIHAFITSLLYRNSPENLKFIMIDPKRVELTLYNKIPHLLTPVITDAKKAILALKWAAKEMDRRYDLLEKSAVRDVESYHKNVLAPALKDMAENGKLESVPLPEPMPYIVIIIDELADIMQTYPRELESAIVRLAQMSRAVGIHLMLSTQRPSVNVITGLIKANVPTRVALQVASQIDSRTILDAPGAEKLLGAGDMLYLGGEMSKPQRLQSAFISENEVKKVVKYLVDTYKDEIMGEINLTNATEGGRDSIFEAGFDEELGEEDDLYEDARQAVIEAGKASTSYIQRKLRVGYARAARLMDMLEQRGVIGPSDGAKPREVMGSSTPADASEPMHENDQPMV